MLVRLLLLVFLIGLSHAIPVELKTKNDTVGEKKPFTLDDVLAKKFYFKSFNGTWITDEEFIYKNTNGDLLKHNIRTDDESILVAKDVFGSLGSKPVTSYKLSPNGKQILFGYDTKQVFRHSTVAKYAIYDLKSAKYQFIAHNESLQLCIWSPLGDSLAFVLNNDLFYKKSDGKEIKLTSDGQEGIVYNGIADWVYEEEVLSSPQALWYSPDGKKITFAQFDDTEVETYSLFLYEDPDKEGEYLQYPSKLDIKYPKPGTKNPKVTLKVRTLEGSEEKEEWVILKAPESVTDDHVLWSVTWLNTDEVLATWMNRRQNFASIQRCDLNGKCAEVTSLTEPKGWVVVDTPECYANGEYCLMMNWIGNWMQIWKLDIETGKNVWETGFGEFTVLSIHGHNETTGDVFYQATTKDDPSQRQIYKNDECLTCDMKDDKNIPCTYSLATFSKNYSYYGVGCYGPGPTYAQVYSTNSKNPLTMWEDNKEKREELNKFLNPTVKYLRVPVEGGYKAAVKLILPPGLDFDSPQSDKKYPMVISVYAGPNSVRVTQIYSVGWETYLSTSRHVIYGYIDGRGSGNKGRDMLYEVNNRLGTVEIDDILGVTKHLKDTYKFIDPERIGIWGWSYGGFATALSLAKDKDRVFQCGIAVAPVTSWIYYDSIYTERFMGLPTMEDNLKNYEAGDVTKYVDNFKNHDFMLIHGSGDDNVHYQQSLILAKALQNATIMFEQVIYADEAHSLSAVQPHLYHSMDHFWTNCLNLDAVEE